MTEMIRKGAFLAVVCFVASVANSAAALAYQTAKIGSVAAQVFTKPRLDSPKAGALPPGMIVNIGDKPRNGFYRATGANGLSGWVQEGLVVVGQGAAAPAQGATTAAAPAAQAPAPEEPKGDTRFYVGPLGGMGVYTSTASMTVGLTAGAKIVPQFGLGVHYSYSTVSSVAVVNGQLTTAVGGASLSMYLGELNYFFQGGFKGIYLSGKAGMALASASAAGVTSATTLTFTPTEAVSAFAGGGSLGYDYFLTRLFSIGVQGNVIAVVASAGTATFADGLVSFKYNF